MNGLREKYPESLYMYHRLMGDSLEVLALADEMNGKEAIKALRLFGDYAANLKVEEFDFTLIEKAVQEVAAHTEEQRRTVAYQTLESRLEHIELAEYSDAVTELLEAVSVGNSRYIHIYGNRFNLIGDDPLEGAEEQIRAYHKQNRMIMSYEKMELSIVRLYQKLGATEKAQKMLSSLYVSNSEFIKNAYFIAYELKSDRLMERYSDKLIRKAFEEVKTKNMLSSLMAALEVRFVQSCLAKGECQ